MVGMLQIITRTILVVLLHGAIALGLLETAKADFTVVGNVAVDGEFPFRNFMLEVQEHIRARVTRTKEVPPPGRYAVVQFTIRKDGRIDPPELQKGSGNPRYDQLAIQWVGAGDPYPKLPANFQGDAVSVYVRLPFAAPPPLPVQPEAKSPDPSPPPTREQPRSDFSLVSRGNDPEAFMARFGRPDIDDTTANDNPRPPMVTRWLVYRSANVSVTYFVGFGERPPYAGKWRLIGFQDARTDQVISVDEALRRLGTSR